MTRDGLSQVIAHVDTEARATQLIRTARRLHRLYVRDCNVPMNEYERIMWGRDVARERGVVEGLAALGGYRAYHQDDPRGLPVLLYREADLDGKDIDTCYSQVAHGVWL